MPEEIGLIWDDDAPLFGFRLAPPITDEQWRRVTNPSNEAMAAAEQFVRVWTPADDVPHISIFEVTAPAWTNERAEGWRQSLIQEIATALDDHTATLRAEVEALRARVAEQSDAVVIWNYVHEEGGGIYPDGCEMWDDGEYIAFDGKDWIHQAAKWVRAKEHKAVEELSE